MNNTGAATALAFFGFSTLLGGFRSTYLPRWISGFRDTGWLQIFDPPLGYSVFMFVALFALIGSAAKIIWLIVFGVNEEKFRAVEAAFER